MCEQFLYGGCGGNRNNFTTQAACDDACPARTPPPVCELPRSVGPCDANIARWYHNQATGRCELFLYGGCGGNANNFATQAQCEMACPVSRCSLALEVGVCAAEIPRFWHNPEKGACEPFIYSGCGGNTNNFPTAQECQTACAAKP